jgi:hypothetical protein
MDRTHDQATTQQTAPAETLAAPKKRFRFVKIEESAGSKPHSAPHASSKGNGGTKSASGGSSGFSVSVSTIY